jgi:hypothetical protein
MFAIGEESSVREAVSPASRLVSSVIPSGGQMSAHCSIQVRLFDGSTIRTRFSSGDSLAEQVRKWIDENRSDTKFPYTFKVLLTPLPNRVIDVTEEGKSLRELGLAPSATLVLAPVAKAASAYSSAFEGPSGGVLGLILSYITGFFAVILSFFTTMFSTSGPPAGDDIPASAVRQESTRAETTGRDGSQAKQQRNEQQFYNGNSVSWAICS